MLGLKFIEDTQFDLWCGPKEDFTVDFFVDYDLNKMSIENPKSFDKKIHIGIGIDLAISDESKNVKIEKIFHDIKSISHVARRVTIICSNKEVYSKFRDSWDKL